MMMMTTTTPLQSTTSNENDGDEVGGGGGGGGGDTNTSNNTNNSDTIDYDHKNATASTNRLENEHHETEQQQQQQQQDSTRINNDDDNGNDNDNSTNDDVIVEQSVQEEELAIEKEEEEEEEDNMKDLFIMIQQQVDIHLGVANGSGTGTGTGTNTVLISRMVHMILQCILYYIDCIDSIFYYTRNKTNPKRSSKKKKSTTTTGIFYILTAILPIVMLLLVLNQSRAIVQTIVIYSIHQMIYFVLTIVGTTIGIAFGLGFASHICNMFDTATATQLQYQQHHHHTTSSLVDTYNNNNPNYNSIDDPLLDSNNHKNSDAQLLSLRRRNSTMMNMNHQLPSQRRMRTSSTTSAASIRNMMISIPSSTTTSTSMSTSQVQQQQQQISSHGGVSATATALPLSSNTTTTTATNNNTILNNSILEDGQTYYSLMASAGYTIIAPNSNNNNNNNNNILSSSLRGQVIRTDQIPLLPINYLFTNPIIPSSSSSSSVAVGVVSKDDDTGTTTTMNKKVQQQQQYYMSCMILKELFPIQIPNPSIQIAIGTAMEYIIRDFVAAWYCKMDTGCQYNYNTSTSAATTNNNNNNNNGLDPAQQQQQSTSSTTSNSNTNNTLQNQHSASSSSSSSFTRSMLYSVAIYRSIPFIDTIYYHIGIIFGNLTIRVEQNVNVMELLLLKYTKILAGTFKWYRYIRKQIKTKLLLQQQSHHTTTTAISTATLDGTNYNNNTIAMDNNNTDTTTVTASSRRISVQQSLRRRASTAIRRSTNTNDNITSDSSAVGWNDNNNDNITSPMKSLSGSSTNSNQRNNMYISEVAITKEFLINNKLHKAITFGLDVPSLLYSDTNGRSCGIPYKDVQQQSDNKVDATTTATASSTTKSTIRLVDRDEILNNTNHVVTDDDVLAARLYNTNILAECELDYNRVLGHRMVKALVARNEFGSNIVQTLLTEIMAGCVLTPIMSLFSPDTISSWIVMGLGPSKTTSSDDITTTTITGTASTTTPSSSSSSTKSVKRRGSITKTTPNRSNSNNPTKDGSTISQSDLTSPDASIEVSMRLNNENSISQSERQEQQNIDHSIESDIDSDSLVRSHDPLVDGKLSGDALPVIKEESTKRSIGSVDTSTAIQSSDTSLLQANIKGAQDSGDTATLFSGTQQDGGMVGLLSMSLVELQQFMDFDDCRRNVDDDPNAFYQNNVDWEGDACRTAIVRLVLVIEAALLHGRCTYKMKDDNINIDDDDDKNNNDNTTSDHYGELNAELMNDDSDTPVEVTLPEYESMNLVQILMEMTGDINAFEQRVASENILMSEKIAKQYENSTPIEYQPSATELSTLRTLIAAWLENGQIYRTVALLVQAHATILAPFYHKAAFLRSKDNATGFVRQLRSLENVMILVDTIAVLSSPRLDETTITTLFTITPRSKTGAAARINTENESAVDDTASPTSRSFAQIKPITSTTRYLEFHRNESLASSLRSERERRMQSWDQMVKEDMDGGFPVICRSRGSSKEDMSLHKELHHIAMLFYYETVVLAIRDATRRTNVESSDNNSAVSSLDADRVTPFSLFTMEAACPKRRLEIPDDDSSFLLRGQPRVLNAVGVHRDPRNHDHSYKSFAATIEDIAKNEQYTGGRYLRRCLIRYYPSDRTAAVDLLDDARKLDQRKCFIPDTITLGHASPLATPVLSDDFMNNRFLCQRWAPKGTTRSQSLLASGTMEGSDFTLVPRAGKAIEFVYRMSYYERPMVDLSGKHFTVFDSTALGVHRADASALELSDASLSIALEVIAADATSIRGQRQHVELGKDGYPVVWLKSSRKQDDVHVEAKSYRLSFVRAALLITSARHEAQLKCVTSCIKAGSPSKATKALAESYLKPTLKLVEYSGSRSRKKQSVLQRDLKLGVNHIDIDQLRRNALLSPRYPTELLDLSAVVVDVVETPDTKGGDIFGVSNTMFKLKCTATIAINAPDDEMLEYENYRTEGGAFAEVYIEEWMMYRSLKDFQSLHKHLKLQVSAAESSGTAGSRLVGAATAAFAATSTSAVRPRQRKVLIPSLSQASKAGALGVSKKTIFKRKEIVESYLSYLLSPGHMLGRCSELLLFLGASFPLDPNIRINDAAYTPPNDVLGRTEMQRSVLLLRYEPQPDLHVDGTNQGTQATATTTASIDSPDDDNFDDDIDGDQNRKNDTRDEMKNIAVRNKVEKVRLQLVRTRIFELLRYQFGFENASFARNRLLGALKTASFAVTTPSEFQKTLYKLHIEHLNSEAVAGLINMLTNILWPNGTFFESSPPLSPEAIQQQAKTAKELLHKNFPDQVRAILGSELTRDGLDIFHEMLQNRLVVKSMAYMLFDHLWLEVFPEIGDVLSCGAAIDFDTKDI